MIREIETIGDVRCQWLGNPQAADIFIQAIGDHEDSPAEKIVQYMDDKGLSGKYLYVAFDVEDWNRDLSPWEAPPVYGKVPFAGRGHDTLQWITKCLIPEIHCRTENRPIRLFIGGYSLAGLFALWSFYETGLFSGVASASGSLWYPGWEKYREVHQAPEKTVVYLSLGDREEKTKNRIMQKVGDATRREHELLKEDSHVKETVLEWNPGGHFEKPDERTAKALIWLAAASNRKINRKGNKNGD